MNVTIQQPSLPGEEPHIKVKVVGKALSLNRKPRQHAYVEVAVTLTAKEARIAAYALLQAAEEIGS